MSFYKKYELVRMIHEDDVKTFSGFQSSTRQPIYLHLFDNVMSRPSLGRLMHMVKQAEEAGQVIEVGEFGATCYVITDPISRFTTLLEYLEANPPSIPKGNAMDMQFGSPAAAPSWPMPMAPLETSEVPPPMPPAPALPPMAEPRPKPATKPPRSLMEDTRPIPLSELPGAPAPPRADEAPKAERPLFETWPVAGPPSSKAPASDQAQAPVAEPTPGPPPAPPAPVAASATSERHSGYEVGDFTGLFDLDKLSPGRPAPEPAPAPNPVRAPAPTPTPPPGPPAGAAANAPAFPPPPPPPGFPPPAEAAPPDYAQQFGAQPLPPPPPADGAKGGNSSMMLLVVAALAGVVLAAAVVWWFVIRQ